MEMPLDNSPRNIKALYVDTDLANETALANNSVDDSNEANDDICAAIVGQIGIPFLLVGGMIAGTYAYFVEMQKQSLAVQGRNITHLNSALTEKQSMPENAELYVLGVACAIVVLCKYFDRKK